MKTKLRLVQGPEIYEEENTDPNYEAILALPRKHRARRMMIEILGEEYLERLVEAKKKGINCPVLRIEEL